MKRIIAIIGALLAFTAIAGTRPVIVPVSGLKCDGYFSISTPEKNIRFTISHTTDSFDSTIFEGLNLVGETPCTLEMLNQIRENSSLSYGFVPGKVNVELSADGFIQVTVLLFAGRDTLEFSGIK